MEKDTPPWEVSEGELRQWRGAEVASDVSDASPGVTGPVGDADNVSKGAAGVSGPTVTAWGFFGAPPPGALDDLREAFGIPEGMEPVDLSDEVEDAR